jgi:hypothetical protein
MKGRHVLSAVAGLLAAYLLVHAGVAVLGVYWSQAAALPVAPFGILFSVFGALSAFSGAASVGFLRNRDWAVPVWAVTSVAALAAVGIAVTAFGAVWTEYLFEMGAVLLSWLYVDHLRREARAG